MQTKRSSVPTQTIGLIVALFLLMFSSISAKAASGTWTNDVLEGLWSGDTNWLDGIIADGSGNTATFSNELAGVVAVNLDSSRTIGNLTFLQGVFTITNNGVDANVLTLAGPSKPVITIPAATSHTIRRVVLAGANGFVLDGGGQLNLFKENTDPSNTISGGIVFSNASILQVQGINSPDNAANNLALNSITSYTFYNGALNIQPAPNTSPEYGNVNGNLIVPADGIGTLTLPVRFSGSAGDNSAGPGNGFGGSLTGSGIFTVNTRYVRGNVVGDWSGFAGQLNIQPGSASAIDQDFRPGWTNGLPLAAVDLGGATYFSYRYYRQIIGPTNYPIGILSGANPNAFFIGSASAGQTLTLRTGSRHTLPTDTATLAASLVNGAGPLAVLKVGPGKWIITGTNTYTGSTTISNGTVQVGDGSSDLGSIGSGPITNHSVLIFGHGNGSLEVTAAIHGAGVITNIGSAGILTLSGANTYSAPTISTAGKLYVGTASRATNAYILQDAAEGFGAVMGTSGASLPISSLSYSAPGTFDVNYQLFGNSPTALVTNTGNLALNGNVTVNVLGENLSVGTITLLTYGSRSGTGSFVIGTVPSHIVGYTLNDDTVNKRVTLTISVTFDNTLRYVGDANGVWDVDNVANQIWQVVENGALTNFYNGAKVRFDDSSTGATAINIPGAVNPINVLVDSTNKVYSFTGAGAISGAGNVVKRGPTTLTVLNPNDYTGQTRLEGGVLQIGDGVTDGTIGSGLVTNNTTILLNRVTGPLLMANAIHGSGNIVQMGDGVVNLSGNSTYSGGLTVNPGKTIGFNNGNSAGIGGGLTVNQSTVALGANINANVGPIRVITSGIFQAGANRVIDATFMATNVLLNFDKTALITVNSDLNSITSGTISNSGAGLLRYNSGGGNGCFGSTNVLWVLTAGSFMQPRNPTVNQLGAITGGGLLGAVQTASGNNAVTWAVGSLNTSTEFTGTVEDGANFAVPIPARITGFTKVGTGTLTFNNANMAYRGTTTVSNGVLSLVGTTHPNISTNTVVAAPGVLRVADRVDGTLTLGSTGTNQILRGSGTIEGNVVLGALGRLEPGFSIGTLTATGSVTLSGTAVMEFSTTNTPNSDRLVAPSIVYGGTLILTNIGGAVTGTNTLQLFSGALSGTFASVVTQAISGVSYDLSQLNSAGIVKLIGPPGVNTNPTNITATVAGGQMTVSWPSSHIGWRLQAQTNAFGAGLSANWVTVAGSTTTNLVILPIGQTNGTVFIRMIYP